MEKIEPEEEEKLDKEIPIEVEPERKTSSLVRSWLSELVSSIESEVPDKPSRKSAEVEVSRILSEVLQKIESRRLITPEEQKQQIEKDVKQILETYLESLDLLEIESSPNVQLNDVQETANEVVIAKEIGE